MDSGRGGQRSLPAGGLAGDSPDRKRILCGRAREVRRLLQTAATVVGGYDGRYNYEWMNLHTGKTYYRVNLILHEQNTNSYMLSLHRIIIIQYCNSKVI